jgi:hypothetical protein
MTDAAKHNNMLAGIRTLVGRQKSITEAFTAVRKKNTDVLSETMSVMVRDCDGLVIATNSHDGLVSAPACLVPRLSDDISENLESIHCAASDFLSVLLHFEVLPDHIDPTDVPSSPSEPVRFVCQLDCPAADLVHHPRWMWLPKSVWLETACLAQEFRRGLDDLNDDFDHRSLEDSDDSVDDFETFESHAIPCPDGFGETLPQLNSPCPWITDIPEDSDCGSPMPLDHDEWVDRTLNASHGIWVTDKRRKSKRERLEIKRLIQSPTGMQMDRYESGASGTDEDDVRSPDFQ